MNELQYFERIERYKDGEMPEEERLKFELDLQRNSLLKEEYDAFLATTLALEWMVKEELNEKQSVNKEPQSEHKKQNRKWWWAAAASLLLLLGFFAFANLNYTNKILAEQSYTTPNLAGVVRGETEVNTLTNIQEAFAMNNYKTAIAFLQKTPDRSVSLNYILGNAYFLNDQPEEAIVIFKELMTSPNEYKAATEWYLALSYLKNDDILSANNQLDLIKREVNHPNYEKAIYLSQKLASSWRSLITFYK